MQHKVKIAVCGAGGRGRTAYAPYIAAHPDLCEIVAVAEPLRQNREELVRRFSIPPENIFTDWTGMAAAPRLADAVIVATQDRMHVEPAVAFMEKGYHLLLEKPMAPTEAECRRIVETATRTGVIMAVCHVLRYNTYFRKLKELIASGVIGDLVTIRHVEKVGYWHQAHSFVRGHWRNSQESSPMILAKSCHDMDILNYLTGKRCLRLSSFGSLKHFKRSEMPAGATPRCLDCPHQTRCPYSAMEIYGKRLANKETGWPLSVVTHEFTEADLLKNLREGPYGRCVYLCDNDVVDHQVVAMQFEDAITAVFTMTAFSAKIARETAAHGTKGEIWGDGLTIHVSDYLTGQTQEIDPNVQGGADAAGGHGGGDTGIIRDFVAAVATNDKSKLISDATVSLDSHLMSFAAERSRLAGGMVMSLER